jgi:hypothetical protein
MSCTRDFWGEMPEKDKWKMLKEARKDVRSRRGEKEGQKRGRKLG